MGVIKKVNDSPAGIAVQKEQRLLVLWWGILLLLLGLAVAFGHSLVGDEVVSNPGFADAAAVIVFVTAIATGVERILEVLWGFVDRSPKTGGWWPLSTVVGTLRTVEDQTNAALGKSVQELKGLLADAVDLTGQAETLAGRIEGSASAIATQLAAADEAMTNAKLLAPGSARFEAVSRATNDFSRDAQLVLKRAGIQSTEVEKYLAGLGDRLTEAADIVGAFSDNPARRSMSLAAGVALAVIVAGYLKLNIFAAILEPQAGDPMLGWHGVLATGVVMGLGANPTHEVIKALQKRRQDTSPVEVPVTTLVVGGASGTIGSQTLVAETLDISDDRALLLSRSLADLDGDGQPGDVATVAMATVVQTTRPIRRTS